MPLSVFVLVFILADISQAQGLGFIWWILKILQDPRYLMPTVYQSHAGFLVSTVGLRV